MGTAYESLQDKPRPSILSHPSHLHILIQVISHREVQYCSLSHYLPVWVHKELVRLQDLGGLDFGLIDTSHCSNES